MVWKPPRTDPTVVAYIITTRCILIVPPAWTQSLPYIFLLFFLLFFLQRPSRFPLPLQSLFVSLASLLRRIRLTFEQRLVYPAGPDTPRDDLPLVIALKGARCHPTLRLWASAAARIAQSDSISSPTLKSKSFVAPRNGFFTWAFNPSTTIINCVAGLGCLDCLMFQVGCTGRRL